MQEKANKLPSYLTYTILFLVLLPIFLFEIKNGKVSGILKSIIETYREWWGTIMFFQFILFGLTFGISLMEYDTIKISHRIPMILLNAFFGIILFIQFLIWMGWVTIDWLTFFMA